MKTHRPTPKDRQRSDPGCSPEFYEIIVEGQLDNLWAHWFSGMTLSNLDKSGVLCTLIFGEVADQAALHGLLIKIRDLNLKLLSVCRVNPVNHKSEEINIKLDE